MAWNSPTVRLDPHADETTTRSDLLVEARGWLLFFKESWVPAPDLEQELHARRALMERWASADQSFRDDYVLRAQSQPRRMRCPATLLDQHHLHQFICEAPVDPEEHRTNYVHLLKILIFCYLSAEEAGENLSRHPFSGAGSHNPPNPQLPTLLSPPLPVLDYSLSSMFLEQADFRAIQMKRDGTAFFSNTGTWFVIDQSGLDTGRIAVVDFKPNGQVANLIRLRPWNLPGLLLLLQGLGWPLSAVIDENRCPQAYNQPLNIDMPLLDILEETKQRREFGWEDWGSREIWTREIDRNAPGYLALEAQGRESEFNLESLRSVCDD